MCVCAEGEARQDVMGISEETGRLVIMESFDDMDDEYELEPRIFLTSVSSHAVGSYLTLST